MSLVQKLLPHRTGYTLDVVDLKIAGGARQLRLAPYGAAGKRIMAGLLAFAFIALTSVSGLFMATAASPKASANWISDIFCTPLGNGDLSDDMDNVYGGVNSGNVMWIIGRSVALSGAGGMAGVGGSGGILAIRHDANENKQTAYEAFTPFLPVFDAYVGYYVDPADDNNDITFKYPLTVKNGKPGTTLETKYTGDTVPVGQSYLFSHDVGTDCLAGAAGKSFAINVSNSMFMLPKLITFFSAEVYGWAIQNSAISDDDSALHSLLYGNDGVGGLNSIITGTPGANGAKGLKDVLYLPFLLPIVMLSALVIAYQALFKNRTSSATSSAIWLVAASITGVLFLSNPQVVPEIADNIVTAVNSATTKALNGQGASGTLCNLSDTPTTNQIAREMKCEIWYNTIYVPWLSGQFGVGGEITGGNNILTQNAGFTDADNPLSANANNLILDKTTLQLGGNPVTNKTKSTDMQKRWAVNWGTFELQQQFTNNNGNKANQFSALAFSQLSANKAMLNQTWGGDPLRQFNAAVLSTIAAIGTLIIVLSTGFLLIGYQISVIFLLMLSPFFFLIGAVPGVGRGIMMRWFELITGTIIKRILLTFVLAIFLRLYSMVMELPDIEWWMKVVILVILSVVAMSQRSTLINAFTKAIDFGGNKNIGDGTDGVRTLGKRLATGAALAGMGAVGARAGFGNVGGAGGKLRSAAGAVSSLSNRNGKGGAAGAGAAGSAGGSGGGKGGVNGSGGAGGASGAGGGGIAGGDPSGGRDINGVPLGNTRPETDSPQIITEELPPVIIGEPYEGQIVVVGQPHPAVKVTNLPAGLKLDEKDGTIKGTATADLQGKQYEQFQLQVSASNENGDDKAVIFLNVYSATADKKDIQDTKDAYRRIQAQLGGSDASRASDTAAKNAYRRAQLNAKDAGKEGSVKGKHSFNEYEKKIAANVSAEPNMDDFRDATGNVDNAAYTAALEKRNAEIEAYKERNPYAEFAKESLESRGRRKAVITGEIDPDDRKRLEARAKAMRQAAMNGVQRGFVDNKEGNIGVTKGELFGAYRTSYQFGDQKSTNAEIKLDAARDRQEAADSRSMLQRQIELQEAGLRMQGWNPEGDEGTLPPPPTSGPTPPPAGGGPRGGGSNGNGGAPRPTGPAPTMPITGPAPARDGSGTGGGARPQASAPTAQMPPTQIPQARVDDTPAVIIGPPNPVQQVNPVAPVQVPATPAQREQARQDIIRARQEGAQKFAEQTGGPVKPVIIPARPNNTPRRVTVTPPVAAPAAPQPVADKATSQQQFQPQQQRVVPAPVAPPKPVIAPVAQPSAQQQQLFAAPAAAPQAPAPDMTEYIEQVDPVQQAVSAPAAPKKPVTGPIPAAPRQQQTQQQRSVPAPAAPKKSAAQTGQGQQQTQQQLRTTSAAPAAPKKPVAPAATAPQPPKQQQQQQVVSAPAAPKKPGRPVKLPNVKVYINPQNPPQPVEPQPVADESPLKDNKAYIDAETAKVQQQYLRDLPYQNGNGTHIRLAEGWRNTYEPYNRKLEVFLNQARQYNATVPPEKQIDLSQYRFIEDNF